VVLAKSSSSEANKNEKVVVDTFSFPESSKVMEKVTPTPTLSPENLAIKETVEELEQVFILLIFSLKIWFQLKIGWKSTGFMVSKLYRTGSSLGDRWKGEIRAEKPEIYRPDRFRSRGGNCRWDRFRNGFQRVQDPGREQPVRFVRQAELFGPPIGWLHFNK